MNTTHNPNLRRNAQTLRKNMTKEERHLWYDFFKTMNLQVHRQRPIGPYIVDFYISSAKIVVELDGSQHFEEDGIKQDRERDAYLREQGLTVLRYANTDINERFLSVCEDILRQLGVETG